MSAYAIPILLACAAPAPLPRATLGPSVLVGTWDMHFMERTYEVTFHQDGSYRCGPDWAGTWNQTGDVLTVREWYTLAPERGTGPHVWQARLTAPRAGHLLPLTKPPGRFCLTRRPR